MSTEAENLTVKFSLINSTNKIVYGVVYAPNMLDAYQGFADLEEVTKLAYRFMQLDLSKAIDTSHDNIPNGSVPVESFIARDNDPNFPTGAWVLGIKINDEKVWSEVVSGELNAFSMEIHLKRNPHAVKCSSFMTFVGETEEHSDHSHHYFLEINKEGRIIGGSTSVDNNHSHKISVNSITETENNHSHRIVIMNK